jgi:hypothetical protein
MTNPMMTAMTDQLREEHASLQRAVKQSRRAFEQSPESAFAKAGREVMDDYDAMRKAGVSQEDAVKGIEAVLRAIWPKPVSKFSDVCEVCGDTGYQEHTCWHEHRCARDRHRDWHPAQEHAYVSPCDCQRGDRFRPRPYAPQDEIAAVARSKAKPKGFTRYGR